MVDSIVFVGQLVYYPAREDNVFILGFANNDTKAIVWGRFPEYEGSVNIIYRSMVLDVSDLVIMPIGDYRSEDYSHLIQSKYYGLRQHNEPLSDIHVMSHISMY